MNLLFWSFLIWIVGAWFAFLILTTVWDMRNDYEIAWGIVFWPITLIASIIRGFRHMLKVWLE